MGANFRFVQTRFCRTVRRYILSRGVELLPVREPAVALAGIVARAIDVGYFHRYLLFLLLAPTVKIYGKISLYCPYIIDYFPCILISNIRKWQNYG